jgi:NADH-quinone oxidoreductase subunit G
VRRSCGYKTMLELEIDGKTVQVPEGSTVMDAAGKLGVFVPHFCYHKKLSIAANCRMCLVQVEKACGRIRTRRSTRKKA